MLAKGITVHLTMKSSNAKTGPIPVSTTSANTCPPSCPLASKGCYAKGGPLAIHWRKVTSGERGTDWETFCSTIAKLPQGQLWRHNQAGDLPGSAGVIDSRALEQLVNANGVSMANGFTYTHYPATPENMVSIEHANTCGFTVNLSANNPTHADELASKTTAPVVTLIPSDTPYTSKTPAGRKVVACPAQYRDNVTCASCGLCARAGRSIIIGFYAHGAGSKAAESIAAR